MGTERRRTSADSGRQQNDSLLRTLNRLASDLQVAAPEYVDSYVKALRIFPDVVIEGACDAFVNRPTQGFARFPSKGEFIAECRRCEVQMARKPASEWSCSDYAVCRMIDRYVAEQLPKHGGSLESLFAEMKAQNATALAKYVRWINQRSNGTLVLPPEWCDECEGTGAISCNMNGSTPWDNRKSPRTRRCPTCSRKAA